MDEISIAKKNNPQAVSMFISFANNLHDKDIKSLDDLSEDFLRKIETWTQFAGALKSTGIHSLPSFPIIVITTMIMTMIML